MKKPIILIVDDHDGFRESLVQSPILMKQYQLLGAANGEDAVDIAVQNPSIACIVLDYDFSQFSLTERMNGIDTMRVLKEKAPQIPILMMSGIVEGRGSLAVDAIKQNAVGFIDKPFKIVMLVERLNQILSTSEINHNEINSQNILNDLGYYSTSKIMNSVCEDVINAAKNDMNIMITGETGTGKTFLTKIIHQLSRRKDRKFEVIHCGLISSEVNSFKSHLFGHVKGAYTGAVGTRTGVFELVEDGTLVIDDITTMPIEVQSGLLEVLDNNYFYKMGDNKIKIPFNARVILTSNQNLNTSIEENLLRKDFRFRIAQEIITIPPLRNRSEDIPFLVKKFFEVIADEEIRGKGISDEALALLKRQPWVGNTRQMFHLIGRAAYHESGLAISLNTIKKELMKDYEINDIEELELMNKLSDADLESQLDKIRKEYIIMSLAKSKGNISETARNLGYQNHNGLQYWLKKYNIDVRVFK